VHGLDLAARIRGHRARVTATGQGYVRLPLAADEGVVHLGGTLMLRALWKGWLLIAKKIGYFQSQLILGLV
jgi:hypothetical protein